MNHLKKNVTAVAALALALSANAVAPAGAAANVALAGASCELAPNHAWTVVRVTVARNGSVEGLRIAFQSGNSAFNVNALRVAAATSFGSARPHEAPASFDYLIASDAHGRPASRIVERLGAHGDDAWTASSADTRVCEIARPLVA